MNWTRIIVAAIGGLVAIIGRALSRDDPMERWRQHEAEMERLRRKKPAKRVRINNTRKQGGKNETIEEL